jgi:NADPH:quinone reductase-like Zn-dependent oxidoreductase
MSQQLAVVIGSDKTSFSVKSVDIPKPEVDEILVKVLAAAQNPVDCECNCCYRNLSLINLTVKSVELGFLDEGCVPGCDYAGIVEQVGSNVKGVKKGDRVLPVLSGINTLILIRMSTQVAGFHSYGTFAQFVRVDGKNFFRIPEDVSFDNAASYGIAFQTATLGLYQTLNLPEPYTARDEEATPILVWGGASKCLKIFVGDIF